MIWFLGRGRNRLNGFSFFYGADKLEDERLKMNDEKGKCRKPFKRFWHLSPLNYLIKKFTNNFAFLFSACYIRKKRNMLGWP